MEILDSGAVIDSEEDPDAYVLQETVKQLAPFIDEVFALYGDARKKLVAGSSRKPILSFSSCIIADVEPEEVSTSDSDSDFYEQVKAYVVKVAAHLKQLTSEREAAKAATENAITQLQTENSRLSSELSRCRANEISDSADVSNSSSFSDTNVEAIETPRSRSFVSDSTLTPRSSSSSIIHPAYRSRRSGLRESPRSERSEYD